jgi:hypothetical protein
VLIAAFTLLFLVETTAKAANGNVSSGVLGSVVAFALSVGGAAYLVLFSVPLLTVPVLIALWAYPLAPFMWKRTRNPCSTDWMFLDEGTQTPSRLVVRPTGIWRAAASGVTAGVVFVLADVLITWQHYSQPVAARSAPDSVVAFFETLVGVAVLTQVVVAVFVALRSPALRVAHALFAAFVTGVAASASLIVVNIVFGGTVGGQFALTVYSQIVQVGALAACLAAALCHLRTSRASPTARLESPARKLAA